MVSLTSTKALRLFSLRRRLPRASASSRRSKHRSPPRMAGSGLRVITGGLLAAL